MSEIPRFDDVPAKKPIKLGGPEKMEKTRKKKLFHRLKLEIEEALDKLDSGEHDAEDGEKLRKNLTISKNALILLSGLEGKIDNTGWSKIEMRGDKIVITADSTDPNDKKRSYEGVVIEYSIYWDGNDIKHDEKRIEWKHKHPSGEERH